ncbi:hypothetical protein T484DRAFT_1931835, partial [Baffinella frigidus]
MQHGTRRWLAAVLFVSLSPHGASAWSGGAALILRNNARIAPTSGHRIGGFRAEEMRGSAWRAGNRRGVSRVVVMVGAGDSSDDWMFTSARNQDGDKTQQTLPLIARPFGIVLLPGDEEELTCSPAEEMLVRSAMGAALPGSPAVLAYTAGKPNAYIAGTAACRCEVVSGGGGVAETGGFRCVLRAVGRVKVRAVQQKAPFVTAVCVLLEDVFIDPALFKGVSDLESKVAQEYDACQQLLRASVEKGLSKKLKALDDSQFLLSIPDEQLLSFRAAARDFHVSEPVKSPKDFPAETLEEQV